MSGSLLFLARECAGIRIFGIYLVDPKRFAYAPEPNTSFKGKAMVAQTFSGWVAAWLKTWLLPKFGSAAGVFLVSAVLFSIEGEGWFNGQARDRFLVLFARVSDQRTIWIVYALAVPLIAAIYLKAKRNATSRTGLFFERSASRLLWLLNFILGLALVPLVVVSAYAWIHRSPAMNPLLIQVGEFGIVFIVTGAALHWLMNEDENPPNHLTYTLVPIYVVSVGTAVQQTRGRLAEVLSHVPFVSDPVIVAHSKDNQITLVIALELAYPSWSIQEKQRLAVFLNAIEVEWTNVTFWRFTRSACADVEPVIS